MADIVAGSEEADLIAAMQTDTAKAKVLLARIAANADRVATINFDAGRSIQGGDAMIWAGAVRACHGNLIAAHGAASKALVRGFDNGGVIVVQGGGR